MIDNGTDNHVEMECPFLTPEKYVYGEEARRYFEVYKNGLLKETDISKVWRWYGNEFFPYDLNAYIDEADRFLPDNIEGLAQNCDRLRAPVILYDIFACCCDKYGSDFIGNFLKKAPICTKVNENEDPIWNGYSFAAPIMLDYAFQRFILKYPVGQAINGQEIEQSAHDVGKVLLGREDGYFLVWNYIKYLLLRNVKNKEVTWWFVKGMGDICTQLLEKYYNGKDWLKSLRPKREQLDVNRKRFDATGLLGAHNKESMYLNLLAQMQFYHKDDFYRYVCLFEDCLKIDDNRFQAFEERPLLCHYYISNVYLATDDPVKAWSSTWEAMHTARYRLWFNRYDEFSNAIERNINYLLLVGIALMEQMYSENVEDLKNGLSFSKILYDKVNDLIVMRGSKVSMLHRKMIRYIIVWRFMFFKRAFNEQTAMNQMVECILGQNWLPRHLLETICSLRRNKFDPWLFLTAENAEAFYHKVKWAADYAVELEPCEYQLGVMGRDIKTWCIHGRKKAK